MAVNEARKPVSLEDENARLKRILADLSVQNQILKEINSKSGRPFSKTASNTDDCYLMFR